MAAAFSPYFPDDFLAMMRSLLPEAAAYEAFLRHCQQPLRRSIRVNTLKISVTAFEQLAAKHRWHLTPVPWCPEGFWIQREPQEEETLPLGSVAAHLSGLFYIQEASSMLPVCALFNASQAFSNVLDMAAAPGSKTSQLAAGMHNRGFIVANELSASRLKVLHATVSRCALTNTALTHFDGRVFGAALPETFDAVLLDAPCSGEGVIRKDAGALRNWSWQSNEMLAATQRELLDSAFHALKPGGMLIYSTCTLNTLENQSVIQWLLNRYPAAVDIVPLHNLFSGAERALTPEGYLHVFPHIFNSEGFFIARLRKTAAVTPPAHPGFHAGRFPFNPLSRRQAKEVTTAANACGLWWSDTLALWQRDKEIWLFPHAINALAGKIRFSRIGVKLARVVNDGWRWQHEAVIAFARPDANNSIELNASEARAWYKGQDLWPSVLPARDNVLLTFQQQPVGLAKRVNNRLKNSYPRELVRDGRLFPAEG